MIEIVFSDSAAGSLKLAQHYGEGPYRGGAIGVILSSAEDGYEPTQEEIEIARYQADEQEKARWESAKPLGGDPADVFGLSLALSVGDIGEEDFFAHRKRTLDRLFGFYPEDAASDLITAAKQAISAILDRAAAGEAIRIWYSDEPNEQCGLYWFADQLVHHGHTENVFLIKLPKQEVRPDGVIVCYSGWGDMEPGGFGRYVSLQQSVGRELLRYYSNQWAQLRAENAPLRAVINGELRSAPADFYDYYIRQEISAQPEEFNEAVLIGRVLGKYRLGIGDGWVALRVEEMISRGELEVIAPAGPNKPLYHRLLCKTNKNH